MSDLDTHSMRLVPSFAPSVSQFREVVSAFRTGFEGTLPPLLDDIIEDIIEYAGYYVKDTSFSSDRMSGGDWEETYVIAQPVDFDKGRIKEIKVDAEAHDQGWSSYPQDQNTYNNSWTFAELARMMPDGSLSASREEIYRNLHAVRRWQQHSKTWSAESSFVQSLQAGDRVAVVLLAMVEPQQSDQGRATRLDSGLRWLNAVPDAEASEALIRCCGSKRFASGLAARRPFRSFENLQSAASDVWWNQVDVSGWLEAFSAHPRIGDVASLKRKFSTQQWSQGEQAAALQSSDDSFFQEMAECNGRYEQRFRHIFIICAQGKPAPEILAALKERLGNQPIYEVQLAAKEQEKITQLRLEKLLLDAPADGVGATVSPPATYRLARVAAHISPGVPATIPPVTASPATAPPTASAKHPSISTHVLDVALGRPAAGINVVLERQIEAGGESREGESEAGGSSESGGVRLGWERVGEGVTNADGRAAGLLARGQNEGGGGVGAGIYRLSFATGEYLGRMHGPREAGDAPIGSGRGGGGGSGSGIGGGFFPQVSIVFRVLPEQQREHFHVPLLLSPFSYSTYRGS
ncbi:unnamed protein product [Closterium sp. Yama58-4]|nr:unnamed protein product [Closterium sp. Yama58-4]